MEFLWTRSFQRIENSRYPVFRQDLPECVLFYAPGYLVLAQPERALELERQLALPAPTLHPAAVLLRQAQTAQQRWERIHQARPINPLCLTLYTSQRCNLNCSYCFSQGEPAPCDSDLDLNFILQAAEWVSANCKRAGAPFTLVIHGGGEPTLDQRLPHILAAVEQIAARQNRGIFRYLATNGVMPAQQARWAAEHFDQLGLSCDGPPDIQAAQRPLKNGRSSVLQVERTAQIIRRAGKPLHVRATITAQSFERMPEIAAYLCAELHASEVRIEPVFQGGRTAPDDSLQVRRAEAFCAYFLEARQVASRYGARWSSSGSRPGEVHGRYCQVFRDVLHLTPGNGVSACFKVGSRSQAQALGLELGSEGSRDFEIDPSRVSVLQGVLAEDEAACRDCFNQFHCARGCPDRCPADPQADSGELRCALNRMLSTALLQERAQTLLPGLQQNSFVAAQLQGGL
jgi:sulfatase maturation enzyme AslB (radical SAM superfamily)